MTEACFGILLGLALLVAGGEALVRGAGSLAVRLGLTPLVAGLTVVAFATSMPELVASLNATFAGKGNIAVGNAIGSNIFNVGMVLGLTALACPLRAGLQLLKFDVPVMLGIVALPVWVLWDGAVSKAEGAILLGLLVAYTVFVVRAAKATQPSAEVMAEFAAAAVMRKGNALLDAAFIAAGIAMLVFGSRWLVDGAVVVAHHFGVSDAVIGLTIVAMGTSTPELAASLVASFRRQPDVALGNVIGSNIFNVLAILGTCGLARGVSAPGVQMVDVAVMLTFAASLLPMLRTGMTLERWEGFSLVAAYGVYMWWLWPK
jgi:cation:H+ antiporter